MANDLLDLLIQMFSYFYGIQLKSGAHVKIVNFVNCMSPAKTRYSINVTSPLPDSFKTIKQQNMVEILLQFKLFVGTLIPHE